MPASVYITQRQLLNVKQKSCSAYVIKLWQKLIFKAKGKIYDWSKRFKSTNEVGFLVK